jgi:flagellar hook-length control protein FliK
MNIGTLQLASAHQQPMNATTPAATTDTNFAQTLHQATVSDTTTSATAKTVDTQSSSADSEDSKGLQLELGLNALLTKSQPKQDAADVDVAAVLNATSLSELGADVSDLDLVTGAQQLSLEDIAQALDVDPEQLTETLSALVGQEVTADNLWDALDQIDMNIYTFMQNLSNALEGKGAVSQSAAADVTKLLKFIEIAAPKTDLMLKQEMQVSQLKDWMSTVASRVTETLQTNEDAKKLVMQQKNIQIQVSDAAQQMQTVVKPTSLFQTTNTMTKLQQAATQLTAVDTEQSATSTEALGNASAKATPQTTTVTFRLPQSTPASQAASFVQKFEQIMSRSQMANNAQGQRLLIKLYPEELGSVRIEFIQKDGLLSARILTSTAAGKQMIEGQLNQLKSGLASQNIQLDRLDISQALSEPGRSERGQQFNQQSANQQQTEERKEQREEDESYSFEELLAELEV